MSFGGTWHAITSSHDHHFSIHRCLHPGEFVSLYFWVAVPYALVSAEGFVLLSTTIEPVDAPGHKEDHFLYMAL